MIRCTLGLAAFSFLFFSTTTLAAIPIPSDADSVRSLDGTWRFKLEQAEGKNQPSDGDKKLPVKYPDKFEPFYQPDYKEGEGWHDIAVPGNWEMAGFSPATYNQPDNGSGFYRLTFDVPKSWEARIIRINFDGVQNGAEFWLNGKPVQVDEPSWGRENYHEGGWTAFQVDLTSQVKFGEKNLLAIRVTKNTKSVELDTGDYFFLGGVHRPVTLFAVPQAHLDEVTVHTKLAGEVGVNVRLAGVEDGTEVRATLQGEPPQSKLAAKGFAAFTFYVANARLWSAEFPNLYDLAVEIEGHRVTQKIGIREVTNKEGVLLINGKPVKLAGFCRHDVSAYEGTAITPATWRKDIEMMKAANVNAIRTSHYPYGKGFYDLCDELGMYVLDELPYCWTPTDDKEMEPAFLQRARETVRRDKNHPSVIVWTVGNENRPGKNLQAVADLVKQLDDTRPRNVSEFDSARYKVDISDKHYPAPDKLKEFAKRARESGVPFICVEGPNTWDVRLAADPGGLDDPWSTMMQRCWDVVEREPTLAGTFIWEWQDRAICDKSPTKLYYYYPETGINLLKIKGVVDAFRNPGPRYYHVKMIYSPLRFGEKASVSGDKASFEIENRYSFTNLSQLAVKWQLLSAGKAIADGDAKLSLAPLSKNNAELQLPADALKHADALRIDVAHPSGRHIVAHQYSLKPVLHDAPLADSLPENLSIPTFNLITRETRRDKGWKVVDRFPVKLTNVKIEPAGTALASMKKLTADVTSGPDQRKVGTLQAEFESNELKYHFQWTGPAKTQVQEVGWTFSMPAGFDRFSWDRAAPWTVYPETHIGRPRGTATPDSMNVPYTKMDRPDAFDFNSTKYHCNWASLADASGNGLCVSFSGKQRFHCRGGVSSDQATTILYINQQVSPPDDISTNVVRDLCMTLNPGDKIEGSFRVGSIKH